MDANTCKLLRRVVDYLEVEGESCLGEISDEEAQAVYDFLRTCDKWMHTDEGWPNLSWRF